MKILKPCSPSLVKFFSILSFILYAAIANANNYFFSSSEGDDLRTIKQAQNPSTPWKSLKKLNTIFVNLKPGDSVLMKRGETFIGSIFINQSGEENSNIVISSYGSTNIPPTFEFDLTDKTNIVNKRSIIYISDKKYITIDGINFTDTSINPSDHNTTANVGYAIDMNTKASYINLKNINISLIGIGVGFHSSQSTIKNCRFENMRMVVNTPAKINNNDDFGANGIVMSGADNIIENCYFKDLWATSYDYKFDGGAIELFGNMVTRNRIIYNTAVNCNGFMEVGGTNDGQIVDNLVAYNLLINNGSVAMLHTLGAFGSYIKNLNFFNNNIIETEEKFTRQPALFCSSNSRPSTNTILNLKNNIFWINTNASVVVPNTLLSKPQQIVNKNNIYNVVNKTIGYTLEESEHFLRTDTEKLFVNTSAIDPLQWEYNLCLESKAIYFGQDVGLSHDFSGALIAKEGSFPDAGILEYVVGAYKDKGVLPVNLMSYTAKAEATCVRLNWQTASEKNNKLFIISHSNNGLDFSTIGNVTGSCNSNNLNSYTFLDIYAGKGNNYYKLVQVDLDGKVKELGIKVVNTDLKSVNEMVIYPNPSTDVVYISFKNRVYNRAELMDLNGRVLTAKQVNESEYQLTFDLLDLKPSTYLIRLSGVDGNITKQIIKN